MFIKSKIKHSKSLPIDIKVVILHPFGPQRLNEEVSLRDSPYGMR